MFRGMRRSKQLLPEEETRQILDEGITGILAVVGDGGYPYTVPMNYVWEEGAIYLHCATVGHKMDAIQHDPKVSFCVVAADEVMPADFTTHYRSVIAFGTASVLEDEQEKLRTIRLLNKKYAPEFEEAGEEEIRQTGDRFAMIKISIEHLTGKEGLGLLKQRQSAQ